MDITNGIQEKEREMLQIQHELVRQRLDMRNWRGNLEGNIAEMEGRIAAARRVLAEKKEEMANLELQIAMRTRRIDEISDQLWGEKEKIYE